ncbi:MAG TPA: L-threonylcarbamoyladenylate synthase [Candidatus Dormibacteraeota bacterium]|nr:L-threonylcarbamoyladenylate synthase [Candidatus Dormibacteraeota bacterium]
MPARARRIADGPAGRDEAVRVLAAGGIVAVPTDTVYGIAVALATPGGIERLFAAKSRPPDKAIALLLADVEQASDIGVLSGSATRLARAFWPGGLTLVVERRTDRPMPAALTGGELAPGAIPTVGLRVPAHDAPRALARALGPLPTTSANRSGEPELRDAEAIEAELGAALDLILDGGPSIGGPASTVVDCTGAQVTILRAGAIPAAAIEAAIAAERPVQAIDGVADHPVDVGR